MCLPPLTQVKLAPFWFDCFITLYLYGKLPIQRPRTEDPTKFLNDLPQFRMDTMKSPSSIQFSEPILIASSSEVHYGFPRIVGARNGDLLLFYRVGTTHAYDDAVNAMRISEDNGKTWSDERVIFTVDRGVGAHNPVAFVAPDGTVIFWCSLYEYSTKLRKPCWWSFSSDHGRTWEEFSVFDDSKDYSCYYVIDAIATSGGLLAAESVFPPSGIGNCYNRIVRSLDGGRSWQHWSDLTSPDANDGDEVALMETEPGTILCHLRDRGHRESYRLWSHDGGKRWSSPENITGMLGCILQRPFLTRLDASTLILSGRDVERKLIVAWLSRDNGRTFGDRTVLDSYQKDGAYTSALPTGPRSALMAWYSDSHTVPLMPDIKLATLTVFD